MAIAKKEGPKWLGLFLAGHYFSHCKHHVSGKNEKNHFCIDCVQGPLCSSGLHSHASHNTLQVRRASHMDAVRISEIQKYLDVSNIQSYTINGAKIIFLLSRPHSKIGKAGFSSCEICERSIADPVRFCSIACKLVCAKQNLDDTSLSLPLGFFEAQTGNAGEGSCLYKEEPITPPMLCGYEDETRNFGSSASTLIRRQTGEGLGVVPWKKAKLHKSSGNLMRNVYPLSADSLSLSSTGFAATTLDTVPNRKLKPSVTPGLMPESSCFAPSTPESDEFLSFRARPRKGTPHRAPLS